jgi:hypothetical protein
VSSKSIWIGAVRGRTTAALAVLLVLPLAGCGSKGGGEGSGPAKAGPAGASAMTVDQLRDAVVAYSREYEKEHPIQPGKDFYERPTKDEFYAKFGTPDRVSEVGDDAFLYYRCKDGTARVKANKGVFGYYKRVHVVAVEQAN